MDKKVVVTIYIVGIMVGAGFSALLAAFWLGLSSWTFSMSIGSVFSIIGISMWENIGEAIIFSVVVSVLAGVFYLIGPEITWLKEGITPAVVGLCSGKLVVGIAREITGN